jgi:hypothetical protein
MSTKYICLAREFQQSEAITNYRSFLFESQATGAQTLYVAKNGATPTTAFGTVTQVQDSLFACVPTAADLDTLGDIAFESRAAADTTYIYGMRVVSHDPVADLATVNTNVASVLADTGTDGVVLAANAITDAKIAAGAFGPDAFAEAVCWIPQEIQLSEATTVRREIVYRVGTAEAQTVTISKAGAAFGAATGTAAQLDTNLYKLTLATGDVDTLGPLVIKSAGTTGTTWICGVQVVQHDPYEDLTTIRQALVGKTISDTGDGTIKIYAADGITLLVTLTKSTTGDQTTFLPS